MTDLEFDLIDNLYFVQRFEALCKAMEIDEEELKKNCHQSGSKGRGGCFYSACG